MRHNFYKKKKNSSLDINKLLDDQRKNNSTFNFSPTETTSKYSPPVKEFKSPEKKIIKIDNGPQINTQLNHHFPQAPPIPKSANLKSPSSIFSSIKSIRSSKSYKSCSLCGNLKLFPKKVPYNVSKQYTLKEYGAIPNDKVVGYDVFYWVEQALKNKNLIRQQRLSDYYEICIRLVDVNPFLLKELYENRNPNKISNEQWDNIVLYAVKRTFLNNKDKRNSKKELPLKFLAPESISQKVGEYVTKRQGTSIKYIENPNKTEQINAVLNDSDSFQYIKNPINKVCILAVELDGHNIKFVPKLTETLVKEAVKQNGSSIQHIPESFQTDYIKKLALKSTLESIKYIKKQSKKIQLYFLSFIHKDNAFYIQYLINPDKEVQKEIVKKSPFYIQYIKNPFEDTILYCYSKEGPKIEKYVRVKLSQKLKLKIQNFFYG